MVAANAFFDTPESRAIFGFIAGADNNNNNNNAVSGARSKGASSSPCSPPANCSSSSSSLGEKRRHRIRMMIMMMMMMMMMLGTSHGRRRWRCCMIAGRLHGFLVPDGDHSTVHTDGTRGVTDTDGRRLAFILPPHQAREGIRAAPAPAGTEVEEKAWDGDAWGGNLVWCSRSGASHPA